jgi:hypothetical protein
MAGTGAVCWSASGGGPERAESSVLNCSTRQGLQLVGFTLGRGECCPRAEKGDRLSKREQETSEESAREGQGSLVEPHLADFGVLIYMNRKYGLLHPMLVDVDLKEGYPDGRA